MPEHALELRSILRWFCLWCLPTFAVAGAAAWLLNLPALRAERARLFLDLLSLGLRAGHSPDRALEEISNTRDSSLGARFHLLAAWIRSGLRFSEALDRCPSLVPPRISAMLVAGQESGQLPAALHAARRAAHQPNAQIRAALSCQIIMLFVLNPLILLSLPYFLMHIFPVLGEITAGFAKTLPSTLQFILDHSTTIFAAQTVSVFLLYGSAVLYAGGNRFTRWLESGLFPLSDWVALRIPWKRKRLYRDFAAMFALILDAGLPERQALAMAGRATANEIFQSRVARSLAELEQGMSLPLVLETLDPPREFAWRLANALQRKGHFSAALAGWFDALDAGADAQEQVAGDVLSTALLILNGLIVALIIAAVMQAVYNLGLLPVS